MKGQAIWALCFFSFLSGLFSVHSIVLWANLGLNGVFQPFLSIGVSFGIPVWSYLLITIFMTLAFLGAAIHKLVAELSTKALLAQIDARMNNLESVQKIQQQTLESLQARVFLVDESLNIMLKDVTKAFSRQEELLKQVQENLAKKFDGELSAVKASLLRHVTEQNEELKKSNAILEDIFAKKLADAKNELSAPLARLESLMDKHEERNKKTEKALLKQEDTITELRSRIERLELTFVGPKPQLSSQSSVEDVRGIGESTGKELRAIGIATVGDLLTTDAASIAAKTGISEKLVEKFQSRAQLAMIPGITDKDLLLLEEVGVANRKELAAQDPFELGKKINLIVRTYVAEGKMSEADRPTIETIDAWIRFAKT
ncbi:MAG: DUF4332 domain-containing protein [Candidatus Bathyarchaeota archaeon]|nr:DUF4332 domain-containing protein [Candidatus Bathyarchaeota archaeon]